MLAVGNALFYNQDALSWGPGVTGGDLFITRWLPQALMNKSHQKIELGDFVTAKGWQQYICSLKQRSLTFVAPGTGFMEDCFSVNLE